MRQQAQPNNWSCLPTAFASILEVSVKDFINLTGHDGSEVIWPKLASPRCFRSWHVQELIKVCLSLGYAVTQIDRTVQTAPQPNETPYQICFCNYFYWLIANTTGVVSVMTHKGNGHALAFENNHVFDPATGRETLINNFTLQDTLWVINRIKE